jgi:hypothetical protein
LADVTPVDNSSEKEALPVIDIYASCVNTEINSIIKRRYRSAKHLKEIDMSSKIFKVGSKYPLQTKAQEGSVAEFLRPNINILLISISNPQKVEIHAFKKGKIRCGILTKYSAIMLVWEFWIGKELIFSCDSSFDARINHDLSLFDVLTNETRMVVDLHVLDFPTNIIRVLRVVTMPPALTRKFMIAVQDQLSSVKNDLDQYNNWMKSSTSELISQTKMYEMGT